MLLYYTIYYYNSRGGGGAKAPPLNVIEGKCLWFCTRQMRFNLVRPGLAASSNSIYNVCSELLSLSDGSLFHSFIIHYKSIKNNYKKLKGK